MSNDYTKISKYISLILRHKPEVAGITLDKNGWADTFELIRAVASKYPGFGWVQLLEIVVTDEKQRYSLDEHNRRIRANQGHSIPVDVELEKLEPPAFLYHGTGSKSVDSILKTGLVPKSRLYVHLSVSVETAIKVGERHGKPVIFIINAKQMYDDGYKFYKSVNGVWMTKEVPRKYLHWNWEVDVYDNYAIT